MISPLEKAFADEVTWTTNRHHALLTSLVEQHQLYLPLVYHLQMCCWVIRAKDMAAFGVVPLRTESAEEGTIASAQVPIEAALSEEPGHHRLNIDQFSLSSYDHIYLFTSACIGLANKVVEQLTSAGKRWRG